MEKGVAYSFEVSLDSQLNSGKFQVGPTILAGDVKVSKDGGAFANITSLPVEIAGGVLTVSLTATEMNADRITVLFQDQADDEWKDVLVTLTPSDGWDSIIDGAYTARHLMRLIGSLLGGLASGGGTGTITFQAITGAKNRVVMTVDVDGNRSVMNIDLTA